jgi:hypothetical protein
MRSLLVALILGSLGCGISISTAEINSPPHPMSPTTAMDIYTSGPPTRPHVDVTLIGAARGVLQTSLTELFEQLRARAQQLGCDALVLSGAVGRNEVEVLVGTCVAYTDGATPSRSAAR